jgi:hypothetical protein
MKKLIFFVVLLFGWSAVADAQQTRPKISQMELAPGENYTIITDAQGVQTYQLIKNEQIDGFQIVGDSLCIDVIDEYGNEPPQTFCVELFQPTESMYVDTATVFTGTELNTDITAPIRADYWEVYRNGIRQNEGATGDWTLTGNTITWAIACDDDLIVIRYPEEE